MAKTITFEIDEDGNVSIDAQGFQGRGCKEATAPFEELLGEVSSRQDKPEARLKAARQVNQTLRGG